MIRAVYFSVINHHFYWVDKAFSDMSPLQPNPQNNVTVLNYHNQTHLTKWQQIICNGMGQINNTINDA